MAEPLNLLLLVPDQLRADYLGCYGHPSIGTKHIDRLAAEGVRLDRAYCAAPLCGPSRISFVTSIRFSEHGRRDYGSCIDFAVPNLVSRLKQAGYRTGMFGKNHCFLYDQLSQIWDEYHEICLGNYDGHPEYRRAHSAFELAKDHPYNVTALLTDEAIDFMDRAPADRPFMCWVNWQDPHPAFCCPEPYYGMFDPAAVQLPEVKADEDRPRRLSNWRANSCGDEMTDDDRRKMIATYMGQIRYVDDQVGRLREYLERSGKLHNTLIVFFSDHGELLGDFGVTHKVPLFYDCLTRIPVIFRYPESHQHRPIDGSVFRGLVEEVDLTPTILEALGMTPTHSMVGQSWQSAMHAGRQEGRDSVLVEAGLQAPTPPGPEPGANHVAPFPPNSHGPGAMVFDGRFKLSMYADDRGELYDLQTDSAELHNRYDAPTLAGDRQRLTELLVRRLLSVGVRQIKSKWDGHGPDLRANPPESRYSRPGTPDRHTIK